MQWISEASAASFKEQVLERSASQLVIVDFWAPWCQPCRLLAPVLDEAVEARAGRVWLVKVNTEQDQTLAMQYRVQSIPAVKAFLAGRLVDEFIGLRDRRFVDAFLDRLEPTAEDRALRDAEQLLKHGKLDLVAAALGPALESPRHRDDALLLVARAHLARGAFAEAEQALGEVAKESLVAAQAELLLARLSLLRAADGADLSGNAREVEQRPDDTDARWRLAGGLLAAGKTADALEQLLELMRRNRNYRDDGARRAMLGILDELGPEDELAREFRRQMQVYL